MAMLAEPKSKQKWSNDPRNTSWTNDTNRFGYQMLTKMGWESGKGLGAKEDGATTHVKSVKRRDNLGLGADKSNEDNWLSHQLAFDDLLSHLNNHVENEKEEKSSKKEKSHEMEKRARQSRKRVFYNRFIQSKDLSSKSAEDMACIFGQRSKSAPGTPQEQSEGEESDDSTASCPPSSLHGVQTINSGQSIQEYFEMKMKEMKAARERKQQGEDKAAQEEIVGGKDQENGSEVEKSESKKKKKEKGRKRKYATEDEELGNDESGSLSIDEKCSVKKKKKNAAVEGTKSGEDSECKSLEDTKEEKGKKKRRKEVSLETLEVNGNCSDRLETKEVAKDGKKKSKRKREKEKNSSSVDLEISCEIEQRRDKKNKTKTPSNFSEDKSCRETVAEVHKTKDKGKKRKKKDKDMVYSLENVEEEVKEKKKKKKKNKSNKEMGDKKHR